MQQLLDTLNDQTTYPQTKQYRKLILDGDKNTVDLVQQTIVKILGDPKIKPITQLMALKFAQDTMELFNDYFIETFQHRVLPKIETICRFKKESSAEDRGKYMFTEDPQNEQMLAIYGNSLLTLALECIWVWSKWFPIDPDSMRLSAYKLTFERLFIQKVKFIALIYYDPVKVEKSMPQCMVPLVALHQCQKTIQSDLKKNITGSSYRILSGKLMDITNCMQDSQKLFNIIQKYLDNTRALQTQNSRRYSKLNYNLVIQEIERIPMEFEQKLQNKQWLSLKSQNRIGQIHQLSDKFMTQLFSQDGKKTFQDVSSYQQDEKSQFSQASVVNTVPVTKFSNFKLTVINGQNEQNFGMIH